MRFLFTLITLVLVVSLVPQAAYAARIFLDPVSLQVNRTDTFYVPVRVDAQGVCINAAHVAIAYDPSALSVQDISTGDSFFTLWTVPPRVEREGTRETGKIIFEGGIPGGYCGRVEGDPGLTNILARLVVSAVPGISASTTDRASLIVLPETQVILHDGQGTIAPLTVQGADFTLLQATGTPSNVWLSDVKRDTIMPEFFDITLVTGPSVGNNRHYIAFSTIDKQSGIDHYEILETDPDRFGILTWVPRDAYWVRGESPYILRDQNLHSKIMVKAIDKAGNERVVEYTPPMSALTVLTRPLILFPAILTLVVVGIILFWVLRHRRRVHPKAPVYPPDTHDN